MISWYHLGVGINRYILVLAVVTGILSTRGWKPLTKQVGLTRGASAPS
jgi:hypothetical protein